MLDDWYVCAYDARRYAWDDAWFKARIEAEMQALEWYAQGFHAEITRIGHWDEPPVFKTGPATIRSADDEATRRWEALKNA